MKGIARVAAALLVMAAAVPATADARLKRCDSDPTVRCGKVSVPLDRTGRLGGKLGLYVEHLPAPRRRSRGPREAVFALAGGPGQPATEFTLDFLFAFGDDSLDRDLVTFDQRGTGRSGLLRCPEVERVTLLSRYAAAAERCADRLGARRGLYTTSQSVEDMERVRRAIRAERIAIYGASYGTKVALAYAARYPHRVERLVLDSVVTPEGPDPLYRDTFAAAPRVVRAACAGRCDFTPDAGEDLLAFGRDLARAPAAGWVVNRRGRREPAAMSGMRLMFLMLAGDFSPAIRAALPAAVHNARRGDPAPLLRLAAGGEEGAQPSDPSEFSTAIFTATICEEVDFPWQRGAAFEDRERQTAATVAALGESAFTPFGPDAAMGSDLIQLCRRWSEATPPPGPPPPLPDVPTLIVEGELDLRTPIEGAQRLAARLPRSTLLTVPATGHSALGADPSSCALRSVERFLAGRAVRSRCSNPARPPAPERPAPLSVEEVDPMPRAPRSIARVLAAVDRTLDDVEDQAGNQAILSFDRGDTRLVRGGGLRGGRFRLGGSGISLTRVAFVPGVRVSGRLENRASRIGSVTVTGPGGLRGRLDYRGGRLLSGRIGARRFRFRYEPSRDPEPPEVEVDFRPLPKPR